MKKLIILSLSLLSFTFALAQSTHNVMSCNIRITGLPADEVDGRRWDDRKDVCLKVIKSRKPDIICMQEVIYESYAYMKKKLKNYMAFGFEGPEMDPWTEGYHFIGKNVIFFSKKRYEFVSAGTYWLSETPLIAGSSSWETARARQCNWVRLRDKRTGHEFRVLDTHLDHITKVAKTKQTEVIVAEAAQYAEDFPQIRSRPDRALLVHRPAGIPLFQRVPRILFRQQDELMLFAPPGNGHRDRAALFRPKPGFQFLKGLNAPDGDNVVILLHEGMAGTRIGKQTTGKSFHGNISDIGFLGPPGEREVPLGRDIAEGKLDSFKVAGVNTGFDHADTVRGHADMTDPAAAFRFQCSGVGSVRVFRIGNLGYLMKLKEINIIRLHHPKAVFNVGENSGLVAGSALGGKNNLSAYIAQSQPDLLFAVGIGIGGVKEANPAVIGSAKEPYGVVFVTALKRQTPQRRPCCRQTAFPESDGFKHGFHVI